MKKLVSLMLALLLLLGCCAPAMAEDALELLYPIHYDDSGCLYMYARTDFTEDGDMNFTAKTENGDMEVLDARVLRKTGTSWFVILDYPKNMGDNAEKTEKTVLQDLSGLIGDNDNGALVLVNENPTVSVEHAANLRADLKLDPITTDSSYLAAAINKVKDYIRTNSVMDNVVIVIVSPAHFSSINETQINQAGDALDPDITTYIVTVAISENNATSGNTKTWRKQAELLQSKAYKTMGGIGYRTNKLTDDEAHEAVNRIRNAERRKIFLFIDPVKPENVGKTITITQTTAGGKALVAEARLTDAEMEAWKKQVEGRDPDPTPVPTGSPVRRYSTAGGGMIFSTPEPEKKSGGGISTELIIGIILGLVVIALVVVLLLLKNSKGKKKKVSAAANYSTGSVGSTSRPQGPTFTFIGANGATLKGAMKNDKLTIGRDASRGAMVAVPNDGKLSGLHATIMKNGNTMTLMDNRSTNGTKVNGVKVQGSVTLQQNDTITMGSTTYTVSWR